jgi:muramoyltetrapeptide carboxypeptidase LdcA involved in peptidoglycan recycling
MYPHRFERGVQHLESLGLKARTGEHALQQHGLVSDTPQNRVDDIHSGFGDSEVKAMRRDHSCHPLPLLDFDPIR